MTMGRRRFIEDWALYLQEFCFFLAHFPSAPVYSKWRICEKKNLRKCGEYDETMHPSHAETTMRNK
jgi:hypothetical protein